jgi:lipopolysaccharide export system permease protein
MILERYIQTEILSKLGWILGFLLLIIASDSFVGYLADAAAGNLPGDLILELLVMKTLSMLSSLLPVALFLGVVLALTRMLQDRELIVVAGAGIAERFKVVSIVKFSAVFAVLVFATGFYLSPWAEAKVRELRIRAEVESDITGISAGQFREFSSGDMVVYVEQLDNDQGYMRNVFLQLRSGQDLGVLNSGSARYLVKPGSGSRYVLFENGSRYDGQPGQLDYRITRYRTYAVLLEQGEGAFVERRLESIPTSELLGSAHSMYKAELQWRSSYVLAVLLLPVLALAVIRHAPGEGRYLPVFSCILVYFIYNNLLGLSKTLLGKEGIPEYIGLWWVHLLMLAVIVGLMYFPAISSRYRGYRRHRTT